ncbi:MAG TPA: hypothetical protein VF730_01195 [Terracidiphilus sp.]
MRTRRFRFRWLQQNRAILIQSMWLGTFVAVSTVAVFPILAQGPPGAVAAASVAAAAASVSAPAPPAKKTAASVAAEAGAQGNGAVLPTATKPEAQPGSTEEAASGALPPDVAALAAKLASGPPLKGVALQCADLLKLATNLKASVGKSTKDELSVSVVRVADQIEQMAHKMRDGQQH